MFPCIPFVWLSLILDPSTNSPEIPETQAASIFAVVAAMEESVAEFRGPPKDTPKRSSRWQCMDPNMVVVGKQFTSLLIVV